MITHLPTNTVVELELADGTKLENLRTNGNNFVSDTPIEDSVFEGNLSVVKLTTPDGVTEYKDLKLVQNRQFGDVYMFILAEKTPAEKEKEELLQLLADIAELTLEVASDG
jgi:hypothetical protein